MKGTTKIAAAIDLRVRQLAVHRLSDSALVDHMMSYMADLQRLWTSTTDEELAELCDAYTGFTRYATLMEKMSEAMRARVGVPAHVKQLSPIAGPLKRAMNELLTDGVDFERNFQQRIDESRASRFQTKAVQVPAYDTADLDELHNKWCAAVERLITGVGATDGSDQVQQLVRQAFKEMSNRIDRLLMTPDVRLQSRRQLL